MPIPVLAGLAALAARYDGFILDVWGVLHGGGPAFPEATACLAKLRAAGKHSVLLSNAPRRAYRVSSMLIEKGIDASLHDGVVTSGEATRQALEARTDPAFAALGRNYFLFGSPHNADLLNGLDYRLVGAVRSADFLLALGLTDERPSVAHHEQALTLGAARGLPMVCANPDLAVIRLGQRELCAGALAARYVELGGPVHYFGKPFPRVYATCFRMLADIAKARLLAIGDGLHTDLPGAAAVGIDSLLIVGGLFAEHLQSADGSTADAARISAACAEAGVHPVAALSVLRW